MRKQPGRISRVATAAFSVAALGLALAALAPPTPAAAHAAPSGAVTSSDFPTDGPWDFSEHIRKSCRDFTVGSDGVVKAHCYWQSGNTWGVRDTSIDLDDYLGPNINSGLRANGHLKWGAKDFSSSCISIKAALDDVHPQVKARCKEGLWPIYNYPDWYTGKQLRDKLKNENGYLKTK